MTVQYPSEPYSGDRSARLPARRRVSDRLMILIMTGLLFCVGAIMLARQNDQIVTVPAPIGAPVAAKSLLFSDEKNGAVSVVNADSRAELAVLQSGEGSFIRGVLRSLVRERTQRGITEPGAFLLAAYGDGRLIISDPETRSAIELSAFGPDNVRAFARFLAPEASADSAPVFGLSDR